MKYVEVKGMGYYFAGCAFWGFWILVLYGLRPSSKLSSLTVESIKERGKPILAVVLAAAILLCILPMPLSPIWGGEKPGCTNQYELMAESILDGRIDIDYGKVDPKLLTMENPYDADQRSELGVSYHWDHAFYNGHYYMYFGVVPVFLLFLPFRLITGTSLTTYHATQVFAALFIAGVFALFLLLAKKFFSSMSWSVYLSLCAAFSIMSSWYASDAPALYCTAITSALCMEVWSLYFFVKAVWYSANDRQAVTFGVLGSLLGALAFGCRPPAALANLLAIPLLICYIKGKKRRRKVLVKQLAIVMLPYVIIGALLMIYNYARFENPFEFGQSYQLTLADQSQYGDILAQFDLIKIVNWVIQNFFGYTFMRQDFPYLCHSSVFMNFPVCFLAVLLLFRKETRAFLREHGLRGFVIVLGCVPVIITVSQILMSPFLLERYRLDIYWLVGLLSFLSFGILYQTTAPEKQKRYGFLMSLAAFVTLFSSFLFWLLPWDNNFTQHFPEALEEVEHVLTLGFQ